MNFDLWRKIVTFIFLSAGVLLIGFVSIITQLSGLVKFYTPFIVIVAAGIIILIFVGIFKFFKPRTLKRSAVIFFSLCLVAVIVNEGINAYHNSFETMDNHEVDLFEYQPFNENSKVVTLEEDATLKLEGNLPVLDGATALYPLYSAFVKATYPENQYDVYDSKVMVNKTTGAYTNLINGKVDIIFAAGPSERQLQYAEQRGVELKLTPIGREAFVFFVNSKNPVEGLTIKQIQDIYSGKVTNWNEVGGNDEEIRAFQRPDDSGSQTALENVMGDTTLMEAPKDDVVSGMGGIIEQTSNYKNYKNAIGYSFRFFSMDMIQNNEIRHLKMEGIFPDKDTIRSDEYPLATEFYAITAGSDNSNIEPFIQWILSDQGQSLVGKTGYVPVSDGE